MLETLRSLDADVRRRASGEIRRRLLDFPTFGESEWILGFASLGTEPDLDPLLDRLREAGRGVLLPRTGREPGSLEAVPLHVPINELSRDALGVRVPREGNPVPLERISTVLVPGVMFDPWGKRLGRGGGYYDRLLEKLPGAALIGVCFEASIQDEVPTEAHDRRVEAIVTEYRTIDCAG